MKAFGLILISGLFLAAVSCSHKQKSTGEERLKWNQATLVEAYDRVGNKNPKWNGPVREALIDFARIRAGTDFAMETRLDLIGYAAKDAVQAGCDDPLVRFLYCRYWLQTSAKSQTEKLNEFRLTAKSMEASGYAPLRKFYANLAAADLFMAQRSTNKWPDVHRFRRASMANLSQTLEDKNLPIEEAYFAASALFQTLEYNAGQLTDTWKSIEEPLFRNWSKTGTAHLIKAKFYFEWAWRGRGNGTGDQLSAEQRNSFIDRLKEAEAALNKAWSLDPNDAQIPTLMISVADGQGKERPEMELWFQRALKLDTNNYAACQAKLHYLYPQWHGSRDEMLAFGRECVAANRGGKVPLILVDAHGDFYRFLRGTENRSAYWLEPEVWPDIAAGYEKFARVNPGEKRFRYPYAWYAFRCQQWPVFLEQIELLRKSEVEFKFDYFGGGEVFSNMLVTARLNGARP